MSFISSCVPPEDTEKCSWWFVFRKDEILVVYDSETIKPLSLSNVKDDKLNLSSSHFLGILNGRECFAAEVNEDYIIPENISRKNLRALLMVWEDELFSVAGRAYQVIEWDRNHKYCGKCGTETQNKDNERAKVCPNCGLISYPRISPAIIVAVIKDDKILLAHSGRFRNKMHSVLAGFVEPGETFEECVAREVFEEVNIKVKNIKYFGSQPWPFPNSLMIGFTAEYESGEIKVDNDEIIEAAWFNADELPEIPGKWSIARKLIDWFVERQKGAE